MSLSVSQIVSLLHQVAPPKLAESWDNVGLQIGSFHWKINKIWTALDPSLDVVERACYENVDLLITHHPLFFENLLRIDTDTSKGRIISLSLKKRLAIFCVHTNLDSAIDGVNDVLSDKIGLVDIRVLKKKNDTDLYKLVVFTPVDSEKAIFEVLLSEGAGQIGNYSCCTFRNEGLGTFLPNKRSKPYTGIHGNLSKVKEIRIESVINREKIEGLIDSLQKVHPYETMAYDIYPILVDGKHGLGRVGNLKTTKTLQDLAKQIKSDLNLSIIKVSGNLNLPIKSVAVCSGNGSSLMKDFFTSGAQVYISGDISYHNARKAQDLGLAIIDLGHFYSEHDAIKDLGKRLKHMINALDKDISVSSDTIESDVFKFI